MKFGFGPSFFQELIADFSLPPPGAGRRALDRAHRFALARPAGELRAPGLGLPSQPTEENVMGEATNRLTLAEQLAHLDAETEECRSLNAQTRAMIARGEPRTGGSVMAAFLVGAILTKLLDAL